jgi:hypothetical protein
MLPRLPDTADEIRSIARVMNADLELKAAWRDGTSHLLFDPVELLEKLAIP